MLLADNSKQTLSMNGKVNLIKIQINRNSECRRYLTKKRQLQQLTLSITVGVISGNITNV